MSYPEVLDLPIRIFFALFREGVKIEARQYREQLRIAKCPSMNLTYYNYLEQMYEAIIDPNVKNLPEKPAGPCLQMGTLEARHVLQDVMRTMKRNMGYA